jgi:hypothetical protein
MPTIQTDELSIALFVFHVNRIVLALGLTRVFHYLSPLPTIAAASVPLPL